MIDGLLRNRWTAGLSAGAGLVLLVWFGGAAIAAPGTRIVLIGLLAAAWLGFELWRTSRTVQGSADLFESMRREGADGEPEAPAARELETLRAGFERAVAVVGTRSFVGADGRRRSLRELPWYVFIGAPGSGKTTALRHSGLRFVAGAQGARGPVGGIGGTRNCDWWFAEEAVLLDTAGRYTTQDSDRKADAAAWFGFLDLLKRFRPRQPLNGIMVTVSASDLMYWTDKESARYAGHVRMRLAELHAALGQRLPVYLLVTKTDLIAGFEEFFADLDAGGRAQVWGFTFEHGSEPDPESLEPRFKAGFADLQQRLDAELIDRLHEEPDLRRRAAIYRFPQQFHALAPLLSEFVRTAFAYRQDHEAPLLRGVYFTSGTQEGNPIDRVLTAIARGVGIAREVLALPRDAGKSFFLQDLLRDVVIREADLAAWLEDWKSRWNRRRSA